MIAITPVAPARDRQLSVRLPASTADSLAALAAERGATVSETMRALIAAGLGKVSVPKREQPAEELAAAAGSGELLDCWRREIGPVTRNLPAQRAALSRLMAAHGSARVQQMVRAAGAANMDKYAGKDAKPSSPKQLEEKWDALYLWAKRQHAKPAVIKVA